MLVHFAKSAWWRVGGQGKLHGALDTCRFSVSADGSCQHVEAVQGNHQHRHTRQYRISHHSSSMHAQSPTLHQLDAAAVCACQHRARQHTNDRQQNSGSTQHHGQGPRGAAEKTSGETQMATRAAQHQLVYHRNPNQSSFASSKWPVARPSCTLRR